MLEVFVPRPTLFYEYHRGRGKYVTRFETDRYKSKYYIVDPDLVLEVDGKIVSKPWLNVELIVRETYVVVKPALNGGGEAVIALRLGLNNTPRTYLSEHIIEPFDYLDGDYEYLYLYRVPITASNFPLARIRFYDEGVDKIVFVNGFNEYNVDYVLVESGTGM